MLKTQYCTFQHGGCFIFSCSSLFFGYFAGSSGKWSELTIEVFEFKSSNLAAVQKGRRRMTAIVLGKLFRGRRIVQCDVKQESVRRIRCSVFAIGPTKSFSCCRIHVLFFNPIDFVLFHWAQGHSLFAAALKCCQQHQPTSFL